MRCTFPLAASMAVFVPLALTACGGMDGPSPQTQAQAAGRTGQTQAGQAAGAGFAQALAREYNAFADSEYAQLDWVDQGAFRDKARMASAGQIPAPEDPRRRGVGTGFQLHPSIDIGVEQRAEAIQGRERLVGALSGGAATRNPQAAARAQVSYDCWIEQLEEGWQEDDIERCRRAFNTAMGQLEARPVAAAPPMAETHQVYFEFDSAELTPQGRAAVAAAARDLQQSQANQVAIAGHTDRAGTEGYNAVLSGERARTVAEELAALGVPANRIRTEGLGESEPVVPTPDGVPQPQNRRAVIEFD